MSITHRVKRLLGISLAGAMVLSLMPAGIAAAQTIETDDVEACEGSEGLVEFNDSLGFFESEIECMAAFGITQGDTEGNYNSTGTVTRQQMALFIARLASQALNGNIDDIPESEDDAFDDIADINPPEARDAINWLAALEITVGAEGGDSYNPSGAVTRQQMASFIKRAHDALGVDFSGVTVEDDVFDDVDEDNVHAENINTLAAAGVVAGTGDGSSYSPAAPVTRGQMSAFIVRSIGVLESQDLWNGEFVVEGPVVELSTIVVDLSANQGQNEAREDDTLDNDDNVIAFSDGEAVSVFQYASEDTFLIDGSPATIAAFGGSLAAGGELEVTIEDDEFTHNFIPEDTDAVTLAGLIGNGDPGETGFAIVDPASGYVLQDITTDIATGNAANEFTVDGEAATGAEFLDNLSVGDSIDVEVLVEGGATFDTWVFRHNLTNGTLAAVVAEVDTVSDTVLLDTNATDDGDPTASATTTASAEIDGFELAALDGSSGAENDEYELVIDGDTEDPAPIDFDAVADAIDGGVNGDLTYERVADADDPNGIVSITFDSTNAEVTYEGVVEGVSGSEIELFDGSDFVDTLGAWAGDGIGGDDLVQADDAFFSSIRVDGTATTDSELAGDLTAGDLVSVSVGFGATTALLSITTADLAGEITTEFGVGDTADIEVEVGGATAFDFGNTPFNYTAAGPAYFVDGAQVNFAQFKDAVDDEDPTASGVAFTAVDTGSVTQFRVTTE